MPPTQAGRTISSGGGYSSGPRAAAIGLQVPAEATRLRAWFGVKMLETNLGGQSIPAVPVEAPTPCFILPTSTVSELSEAFSLLHSSLLCLLFYYCRCTECWVTIPCVAPPFSISNAMCLTPFGAPRFAARDSYHFCFHPLELEPTTDALTTPPPTDNTSVVRTSLCPPVQSSLHLA